MYEEGFVTNDGRRGEKLSPPGWVDMMTLMLVWMIAHIHIGADISVFLKDPDKLISCTGLERNATVFKTSLLGICRHIFLNNFLNNLLNSLKYKNVYAL